MASVIPLIPSVSTLTTSPVPGLIARLAQQASSQVAVPSVIVSFATTSPFPITYNASGTFDTLLSLASAATATTPAVEAATSGQNPVAPLADDTTDDTIDDTTVPSEGNQDTLTLDQALARQMLIDLYSSATGLDTTAAANAVALADILQELPADSTAQSIASLLTTNLGLAAAALLDSTGTAATTTTTSNGTAITTLAPAVNPTANEIAPALDSTLLANVDLTAASTAVVGSPTKPAATNSGAASNATAPVAATPIAATATANNVAPTATAAATGSTAVGNALANSAAATAGGTGETTNTLANGFLLDSIAQAATTIETDPAYANAAAGLYLNAMLFHSQQPVTLALADIADTVQPVAALPSVSAVRPI